MTADADIVWRGEPIATARVVCIFVHGRGQSPEEMDHTVLARVHQEGVGYALPRSARSAWYNARAIDPLTDETRAELSAACDMVENLVAEVRTMAPQLPVVVAGFSQGACLVLEWLFAGGTMPDALVAFTGCRVGTAGDMRGQPDLQALSVYLTGSDCDPWIPVPAFAQAVQCLATSGAKLRADIIPERAHEVSDTEIAMFSSILADLSGSLSISMKAAR